MNECNIIPTIPSFTGKLMIGYRERKKRKELLLATTEQKDGWMKTERAVDPVAKTFMKIHPHPHRKAHMSSSQA